MIRENVRAVLVEAYKGAVKTYGAEDIRCYGVVMTDALSSHHAAVTWGIDTFPTGMFRDGIMLTLPLSGMCGGLRCGVRIDRASIKRADQAA